ncbi:MAG: sigma 54-interacting transcriptional regulator [Dehalobacter sp.]|nr:sigma 54-interacting transcriptional regulator [Dehalobacter sp.]
MRLSNIKDERMAFLEFENALLKSIIDNIDEGVFVINEKEEIILFNRRSEETDKLKRENVLGKNEREVYPNPDDHDLLSYEMQVKLDQKPIRQQNFSFVRLDRKEMNLIVDIFPFYYKESLAAIYSIGRHARQIDKHIIRIKETGQENGGKEKDPFALILGESKALREVIQKARKVARYDGGILLRGESGTGKELFARAIHDESRPDGPFIAINCAAIPKSLIESELFGYEGGSFTGAERRGRAGKIELAEGGTLFLDEIGDMPLDLQAVLLRVLEDKKVMHIGGSKYIPVDFRVIAATNKDLWEMVLKKEFREDLYFRLAVFNLAIPPLHARGNDILKLVEHFIEKNCKRFNINRYPQLSPKVSDVLLKYSWPGNVRELENVIAYSLAMTNGDTIEIKHLPDEMRYTSNLLREQKANSCIKSLEELSNMEKIEKKAIQDAMSKNGNNIKDTAKMLGLGKSTIYRKIKRYEIEF